MSPRSLFLTLVFMGAALVSGCAQLTAEHPLFSAADQVGPAPLAEGLWLSVGSECPERNILRRRNFDRGCQPFEIRRREDDLWEIRARFDLVPRLSSQVRADAERIFATPTVFVLAPAIEHPRRQAFAPLYLAEFQTPIPGIDGISYAVFVPFGELPARSILILSIGCDTALRDGPIDGVTVTYEEPEPARETPRPSREFKIRARDLKQSGLPSEEDVTRPASRCVANSQAAVREAARRELIESIGRSYEGRAFLVAPLDH